MRRPQAALRNAAEALGSGTLSDLIGKTIGSGDDEPPAELLRSVE
jgi:hypothetical protein